jgi:hypothetical protein
MKQIELLRFNFTKNDLKKLQEVATLQKLMIMSSHIVEERVERMAENMQSMYFLRLLASTLYEAFELSKHRKYSKFLAELNDSADEKAKKAFESFNRYFSDTKNLCKKIRNNYFYHYNYGKVASSYQKHPKDDPLEIYISDSHANCRYLASDIIIASSLLDVNNIKEFARKLGGLIDQVLEVNGWFLEFSGSFIYLILSKVRTELNRNSKTVMINDPPCLDDLRLNYFVIGK